MCVDSSETNLRPVLNKSYFLFTKSFRFHRDSLKSETKSGRMSASIPRDVKIHPTVLFSIIDAYERRNEKMTRVVGTLLGTNIQGNIDITDAYVVPHRDGDEVAIDVDFAKTSYFAFKKVNPMVNIVGWFATGFDIPNTSCLIHEYYARETKSPVHLTIDTTLKTNRPQIKAYCR
jgi:translation initiation factor 3 subunit F